MNELVIKKRHSEIEFGNWDFDNEMRIMIEGDVVVDIYLTPKEIKKIHDYLFKKLNQLKPKQLTLTTK